MNRFTVVSICLAAFLVSSFPESSALFAAGSDPVVTLTISETHGLDRKNVAVSSGLPFAKGQWREDSPLSARDASGRTLLSQLDVLSRWSDGSVKWVLVSVVVDSLKAKETFEFALVPGRSDEHGAKPAVSNLGARWNIEYPGVGVRTNQLGLPQNVSRKQGETSVELISGDVELMVLGKTVHPSKVQVEDARLEEVGPVRTVVRTQGKFEIESGTTFGFLSRVTIFANGQIDTSYTVINHQVKDFHGYGVSFPLPPIYTGTRFDGRELRLGGPADPAHGVRQVAAQTAASVGAPSTLMSPRTRYPGGVSMFGSAGRVSLAIRDFWQRYPSEVNAAPERAELWFYPRDPRTASPVYRVGRAALGEFTIHVGGDLNESRLARGVLHAFATPEWYLASGVLGNYAIGDFKFSQATYHQYLDAHMEYLQARKFEADEFGFWDLGDGAAVLHPFRRNNEFGISFSMLFHYLRTGNIVYLEDGVNFAKHFRDVDTLHYGDMKGKSIRHTSNHVDGSDYDTAHQWTEGMLLQFLLTGDRRSLEVAREMGEHLITWAHELSPKLKAKPTTLPERVTERNLGWALLSLMFLEDVTGEKQYTGAITALIDGIVASQDLKRGHWPRDLPHPDFPNGGSTFMLGVLTEALLRYHEKTGDDAVANSIVRSSYWLSDEMWNPEAKNLRYKQWDRFWNHYNNGRTIPMVLPGMIYAEYLGRSDEMYRGVVDGTLGVYDETFDFVGNFGEGRNFKSLGMMSRSMPRFFYYYEKVRGK